MSGSAWQDNTFALVIIDASGAFTGLFVYNPAPDAGNLIASIAAAAGTDPYGNAYLSGVASYSGFGGSFFATALANGDLLFYHATSTAGPWTLVGQIDPVAGTSPGFNLNASLVTVLGQLASTGGTAANPTLITTDTTHGLGALGVANLSITTANFTLLPDGGVFISIKGAATGAVAGGSTAFPNMLPAAYTPATTTLLPAIYGGVIAAGENRPRLVVGASGQVTLFYPSLVNGNSVSAGGRFDLQ